MYGRSKIIVAVLGLTLGAWSFAGWPASQGSAGEATSSASSATKAAPRPEPADNSYCFVCHANYQAEKLTKVHQPAGVGCEKCHGMSVKHSGDEDGLTPPEKMYAKSQVSAFCMTCHEKPKMLKIGDHKEFFKDPDPGETCSDCHAEKHRLAVRTRIWDKTTGKLLKDDGVRMMQKDSPATEGAAQKAK
jgi:hypothetical protein